MMKLPPNERYNQVTFGAANNGALNSNVKPCFNQVTQDAIMDNDVWKICYESKAHIFFALKLRLPLGRASTVNVIIQAYIGKQSFKSSI